MTRSIYFYFSANGVELCTPNKDLAFARAVAQGTNDVFSQEIIEKV